MKLLKFGLFPKYFLSKNIGNPKSGLRTFATFKKGVIGLENYIYINNTYARQLCIVDQTSQPTPDNWQEVNKEIFFNEINRFTPSVKK